jgi:hypothetical protein
MTLMDAPKYDAVREKRRLWAFYTTAVVLVVAFIGCWLLSGMPIDWPWAWSNHWRGNRAVNRMMKDVEKPDLAAAYGVWVHDNDWQQHQAAFAALSWDDFQKQHSSTMDAKAMAKAYGEQVHDSNWQTDREVMISYPFDRFQKDWGPNAENNDYGVIQSHEIKAARMYGNVLVVALFLNGRKSKALFLSYDTQTRQLGFSPVELYLGP